MSIEQTGNGIWKLRGHADGPVVCLLGGTHGNELTGIELVRRLVSRAEAGTFTLQTGTLYLILGNLKAIERNTRGSDDHLDLNRRFTQDLLTRPSDGTYEHERACELAPILAQADISIDIHATNKPSVPMICAATTPRHLELFQWFDCPSVLSDPNFVLGGEQVTTDEYVDAHGGIGMCYESGQVTDLSRVDHVMMSVTNVLRAQGIVQDGIEPSPRYGEKEFYALERAVRLTSKGFRFAEGRGLQSFEPFSAGEVIGYEGDQPITAPYDGVLMFPKVPELWKKGSPVCYFAKKCCSKNGDLSAYAAGSASS